ncbi:isopeptide-forming domain-containing fimbrial protein, partial [Bacillus cereus]|uniref:isopeptide-forming domain-containing fimbrial protein n=1 Tax=Bacillus cereus TaxID=1396 RepID=UPI003D182A36
VVPPTPEKPSIHKDVEGKDHLEVDTNKEYKYNVKSNINKDVKGYKTLVISDTLDKRLDVVSAKVLVDGKDSTYKVEINGQNVKVSFNRTQLDALQGKEVNLQITAKIKDGTPIETIPNKADIQLNDEPKVDSNEVTVIPPTPETPVIAKDVEGKEHLEVELNKEYKYNVKSQIAKDVKGYKTLTISDTLDSRLDVVSAKVFVDGKVTNFKADIKDQHISVTFNRTQLDSIQGKEVNLQIVSKIKEGTALTEKIPNKAEIQLNDKPSIDSNTVTVIPPTPEKPVIEKDVEGKNHLEVELNKEYKYNVKSQIAKDVKGYKELTISDTLDSRLELVSAKVLVDGKPSTFKPDMKDNHVSITFTRSQLEGLQGKEVNLQITSKIKEGTALTEKIPNKAEIQLNDEPKVESNEVTVIPPTPVDPNIHKDV